MQIVLLFLVKVDENEEAEKNEGVGDLFSTIGLLSMRKPMGRASLRGRGRGRGMYVAVSHKLHY